MKAEAKRRAACFFFVVYCALMLVLLFLRSPYNTSRPYWELIRENHNLIPFYTIKGQVRCLFSVRRWLVRYAVTNLFGNFFMFIPLGYFLPRLFTKLRKLYRTIPTVAGVIILVEIIQLFTLRGFADIDDLILNVFGAAVGYCIFRLFLKKGIIE